MSLSSKIQFSNTDMAWEQFSYKVIHKILYLFTRIYFLSQDGSVGKEYCLGCSLLSLNWTD